MGPLPHIPVTPEWRHPEVIPVGASPDERQTRATRHLATIRKWESWRAGRKAQAQWLEAHVKWVRPHGAGPFIKVEGLSFPTKLNEKHLVTIQTSVGPVVTTIEDAFNTDPVTNRLDLNNQTN